MSIDMLRLGEILATQDGVISRKQARACGCTPADIRRFLRRREWSVVFPGIYTDHTGPLTWGQRAWAAVLEHRYLIDVERPHGLPTPVRQAPTRVGRHSFRDLDYPEYGVVIELDGWRFHDDAAARDRDMERDLDAAVDAGRLTLCLGFGQVADRARTTAHKVGRALTAGGWPGVVRCCPNCPPSA